MNVEQIADRVRKEMWLSELTHEAAVEFLRRCLDKIGEGLEPVCSQFQSRDGEWKPFIDANHEHNTRDSLAWPIRELYATPAEAILAAEQKVAEARAEVKSLTLQRVLNGEPVSDRYILGLAWAMKMMEEMDK